MYHHLLVLTDEDRAQLKKRYHTLAQKLEVGSEIERHSIEELAETMRVVLQGQKELEPFCQQVQKNPAKHYHLHLTHNDKELLNLPWQLAIDTKQYPFIHISKGPTATAFPGYKPQPGPLSILIMISSPDDLNYNKRLSYEEEEQVILKALSSLWAAGQVQVHFTEDGSLASLQQKLKLQHYHILYFSGHGIYKNGTGYLQLVNPITHRSEAVKAQELALTLKENHFNTPPLIILSGCQTAPGSMEDGFRGVADELMQEGVPAVIAMSFSIKDQFNIVFAGHLYEHLANKNSLAEAYSKALEDMRMREQQELEKSNQNQYYPSQWLIPQLYLSQQVDYIVDWQAQEQGLNSMDAGVTERADKVLDSQEKNLAMRQAAGDRAGEGNALYNIALSYLEKGVSELYLYYSLESYAIHSEINNLHGMYITGVCLGAFLCGTYPEKYLEEGLLFLEQAYEIGIQSSEFAGVEMIASMIGEFRQPPVKKRERKETYN